MILVAGTDYLSTKYEKQDLDAAGLNPVFKPSAFMFPGIGLVEFEGRPPKPDNVDTIRKRLDAAHLPYPGASDTINIEWTFVSIGSRSPVPFNGNRYSVHVGLTPGKRSTGKMQISRSPIRTELSGTFYSSVLVLFNAVFTNINDARDVITIEDKVVMSTDQPGIWGVKPHRPDIKLLSDQEVDPAEANLHSSNAPNMFDFYQVGGLFEGKPEAGGMVTSAVALK